VLRGDLGDHRIAVIGPAERRERGGATKAVT
jgi:hypothetical protein